MAGYTTIKWDLYLRLIGLGMSPKDACSQLSISTATPYMKAGRDPAFKAALIHQSERGQMLRLAYPAYWVDERGEPILSADFEPIPRLPSNRLANWVRQQILNHPLAALAG